MFRIYKLFVFFHLLFVLEIIQKNEFNLKSLMVFTQQFKYQLYGNGILFDEEVRIVFKHFMTLQIPGLECCSDSLSSGKKSIIFN